MSVDDIYEFGFFLGHNNIMVLYYGY